MIIIKDNDKFAIKSLILHNQNILQFIIIKYLKFTIILS